MKKKFSWFGIPAIMPYIKPYKKLIVTMVVAGAIGSGMDAVIPLFQQYAINNFVANSTLSGLWIFVALYVLVMAVQVVTNYISAFGACKAEMYIGRDLKPANAVVFVL